MTTTANEIVVQSSVSHDVEALVQAAVSVLTNDMQIATHEVHSTVGDQGTVQLLVDTANNPNIQDRLYMCTDCNLAFYGETGEQEWQWHLKQHKPFKCDLCSEGFEDKESLKTHMRSHSMQMPYICDKCGSAYTLKSNLVQHMKTHDDTIYQCAECKVLFKSQINLEKHMKFHTGDTIKVFQCEQCSKTFSQQKNLVQHMKIHMSGDKPYKCSECPASYSYKCHLTRHLMIHTGDKPYKCKICGKSFNRNAHLIRHRKIHSDGEKEWKCNQCGFAFWEKSDLFRHIRSHEGNRPFKCDFCDQTFVWKRYLYKHLNSNHKSEGRFFCQDCCKCVSSEAELIEHQQSEHGNKKALTHTCEVCGEEFYFKYKLDEHMYIHTGRKAHACDKCDEKFVSRKELDRHLAEHSQEISFHCNTCDKTFASIDQLQRHVKLHTGTGRYLCSICNASFRWKSQLSSHMVVHSQDFDFMCSVCNKKFKRKRDLTRHIKIYHDTKPPYTCFECNQDFHSPVNLHKHKSETHWRKADGEEFACDHCSGYFRFKKDLDKHIAKCHPPRPYICLLNNKRFTMMKFLEKHFEQNFEGVEMIEGENYRIEMKEEAEDIEESEMNHDMVEDNGDAGDMEHVEEETLVAMEVDGAGDTAYENGEETLFVVENVEGVDIVHEELLSQLKQAGEENQITVTEHDNHLTVADQDNHITVSQGQEVYTENVLTVENIQEQGQPISEAITLAQLSDQQNIIDNDQSQEMVPMVAQMQDQVQEIVKHQVPEVIQISSDSANNQVPEIIQISTDSAKHQASNVIQIVESSESPSSSPIKPSAVIPKVIALPRTKPGSNLQPQIIKIDASGIATAVNTTGISPSKEGGQKFSKVLIQRKVLPGSVKGVPGSPAIKILNVSGAKLTSQSNTSVTSVAPVVTSLSEVSGDIQINNVGDTIIAGMVPTTAEDIDNA